MANKTNPTQLLLIINFSHTTLMFFQLTVESCSKLTTTCVKGYEVLVSKKERERKREREREEGVIGGSVQIELVSVIERESD